MVVCARPQLSRDPLASHPPTWLRSEESARRLVFRCPVCVARWCAEFGVAGGRCAASFVRCEERTERAHECARGRPASWSLHAAPPRQGLSPGTMQRGQPRCVAWAPSSVRFLPLRALGLPATSSVAARCAAAVGAGRRRAERSRVRGGAWRRRHHEAVAEQRCGVRRASGSRGSGSLLCSAVSLVSRRTAAPHASVAG